MNPHDFDAWARLAKEDPVAFEAARKAALMDLASKAPLARQAQLKALAQELLATSGDDPLVRAKAANARMLASAVQLQTQFLEVLKPLKALPIDDTFAEFIGEVAVPE